jgi:endopolyphosphatase
MTAGLGDISIRPSRISSTLLLGPNSITSQYASIWKAFIPFPSYQIFLRGGYYSVELIANQLAAISLNTIYFYDSNKAVGGCEWVNRDRGGGIPADPGNLELDWLEVQLESFRQRGMKVNLTF